MSLPERALCNLADLKTELSISVDTFDAKLERLIVAATRAIERYCDRPEGFHYEAARVDKVPGFGSPILHAPKSPIVSIGSVVWDPDDANETITASEYAIHNARIGAIYREAGWAWTAAVMQRMVRTALPGTEQRQWQVTYACGWITRVQTAAGKLFPPATVTITRSGTTATVAHTAHGLLSGMAVALTGSDQDEYNGTFTITKIDADSYSFQVSDSPATPATGTITATTEPTVPQDLEDACIQLAGDRYSRAPRDPTIASESITAWSASYSEGAGGMDASAQAGALEPYKRLVWA